MKVKYKSPDIRWNLRVSFSGTQCKKNKVHPKIVFGTIKRLLKPEKIDCEICEYRTRWYFTLWHLNETKKNQVIKKLNKYNGKFKSYLREVEVS